MKKLVSIALSIILVLSMSATALATTQDKQGEQGSQEATTGTKTYNANALSETASSNDVTAKYTAPKDTIPTVYYFTITWTPDTGNDLAYTGEQATYNWDTSKLEYVKDTDPNSSYTPEGWSGSATVKLEVVNSSNADISVATNITSNSYELSVKSQVPDKDESDTIAITQTAKRADDGVAYKDGVEGKKAGSTTTAEVSYKFVGGKNSKAITETSSSDAHTVATISVTVSKPSTASSTDSGTEASTTAASE
jgi:hypothetical protein